MPRGPASFRLLPTVYGGLGAPPIRLHRPTRCDTRHSGFVSQDTDKVEKWAQRWRQVLHHPAGRGP